MTSISGFVGGFPSTAGCFSAANVSTTISGYNTGLGTALVWQNAVVGPGVNYSANEFICDQGIYHVSASFVVNNVTSGVYVYPAININGIGSASGTSVTSSSTSNTYYLNISASFSLSQGSTISTPIFSSNGSSINLLGNPDFVISIIRIATS